jgi:hypothetical protein
MRHWVRFCDFGFARGILGHRGIDCALELGSGCSEYLTTGVVGGPRVELGSFCQIDFLWGILGHLGALNSMEPQVRPSAISSRVVKERAARRVPPSHTGRAGGGSGGGNRPTRKV